MKLSHTEAVSVLLQGVAMVWVQTSLTVDWKAYVVYPSAAIDTAVSM